MNPAEALIDHALTLQWAAVPATAQAAAHSFLHDTLAVGVAGARSPDADAVRGVAARWGTGHGGQVLGLPGLRLPAASAAFVNAFQIHAQEYDCVHEPAVLHPLATVLAAMLAEAGQGAPVHGQDFLAALLGGVDVAVTLGLAATSPLRFFRPATAGIFGSVAALARLRRLDREVALDAFGHALAFVSGTMQAHVEGKPALPLQVANAARGALLAVDLAQAGLPGVRHPIDGPFGYLPLLESTHDIGVHLSALGRRWRVAELSWKPFPTGRAAHGAIVATLALMQEQGLSAEALDQLVYRAPPLIQRLVGRPARAGMTPAYARLCFPWLGAVALTQGSVGLGDFRPQRLNDPALLDIAARITVQNDGHPDPAAFTPGHAWARLRDGRELGLDMPAQWGSPDWPLSPQQQADKARGCLAFAGLEHCHAALQAAVQGLARSDDAARAVFSALEG